MSDKPGALIIDRTDLQRLITAFAKVANFTTEQDRRIYEGLTTLAKGMRK